MTDVYDTRNIVPRLGSPLWIYMVAVAVVGAAVLVIAAVQLSDLQQVVRHPLFWVVASMILAGEVWRIATPGRSGNDSPAASRTITIAALLYWGFPLAVLLRATAVLLVSVAQRHSRQRTAFNIGQLSLSLGAASLALWAIGHNPMISDPWRPTGPGVLDIMLAGIAYLAVNFGLVAGAVTLATRTAVGAFLRANLRYQATANLVLFATAPLVTVAMETKSALIVALFAFPLAAIYISATTSVQREYQANHDELTGLLNRKLLAKRSNEALVKAVSAGTKAGFLLIDLDRSTGLKQVNDTLGHAVGDRLLQVVAHRLSHSVRPGDVVSRLGGDEFAVLLPSVKEPAVAREVASRLRAALAEPVRLETITFDIQASVGIAIFPDDANSFEQLMQRSDVAMYVAKERGSGIERYSTEADRNSADRLALVGELRGAIQRGEIELYFQPKVRLADGLVIGMEALARWPHPRRGRLAAADFVGLAGQSHLASELTEHVIDKALAQVAKWTADGMPVQVCVNLPARDLLSSRLADLVHEALQRYGLPADALRLDVHEQVLAGKPVQTAETVRALVDLGVGVSLDDFGTGYSSLAQLTRLGISEVKLDPALVAGLPDCPDRSMTVKSLVRLAQSLGIRSIGEGVETASAAEALRLIGCDGAQGWHFARPMNALMATEWLAEHQPDRQSAERRRETDSRVSKRHRGASGSQGGPDAGCADTKPVQGSQVQGSQVQGSQLAGAAPGA